MNTKLLGPALKHFLFSTFTGSIITALTAVALLAAAVQALSLAFPTIDRQRMVGYVSMVALATLLFAWAVYDIRKSLKKAEDELFRRGNRE